MTASLMTEKKRIVVWPWLATGAILAALPLSAFPVISAVQNEVLPAGVLKPYQAVTLTLAETPLDASWVGWLDWCCDNGM